MMKDLKVIFNTFKPLFEDDSQEHDEDEFFGVWEIVNVLPSYISGLSQEEVDNYIGEQFTYTPSYYQFEQQRVDNPYYSYEKVPTSDFIEGYKLSYEDWDVEEEEIIDVGVYQDEEEMKNRENEISSFYIIGSRVVIVIEGDFFELAQVSE